MGGNVRSMGTLLAIATVSRDFPGGLIPSEGARRRRPVETPIVGDPPVGVVGHAGRDQKVPRRPAPPTPGPTTGTKPTCGRERR